MFRVLLSIFFLLQLSNVQASELTLHGKVIDGEIIHELNVCVLFIETSNEQVGIVEDIYDCFWYRSLVNSAGTLANISIDFPTDIDESGLILALMNINPKADYIYSEVY